MASPDEATQQRLKSALCYAIGEIVDEEALALNVSTTPQFIGALSELVYMQIANVSQDLENFAKHAGRSTITTDDVLLLTRRNEGLEEVMRNFVTKEKQRIKNRTK